MNAIKTPGSAPSPADVVVLVSLDRNNNALGSRNDAVDRIQVHREKTYVKSAI